MFCNLSGEGFANTPGLISLGPKQPWVYNMVGGRQLVPTCSPFPLWEWRGAGLSKGKIRWGMCRPTSPKWSLWSRHYFAQQLIFSLLPLGNHSPQLLFCMVWRWLTRSRMGVCQVQSVRASHCPGHREWMKNALMTQSEWRRLAGTLAKTSKSVYTWEDLKPGR